MARRTLGLLTCAALAFVPARASAQRPVGLLPQWEARADVVVAPQLATHAGLGVNVRAGHYARLGVAYLAGAARGPLAGDAGLRVSQRADATVRFLLDPFAEQPRGLYGGAGFTMRQDGDEGWQANILLLVGVEGAARGRVVPAVELGLGDGVRIGVVLRGRRGGPYPSR